MNTKPHFHLWLLATSLFLSGCLHANTSQPKSDPARWEKDILQFEKAFDKDSFTEPRTLFVGSSSFRLWNDLEATFPNLSILKRGFGGAHMSDILFYFDRLIVNCAPETIVLYAGENDLVAGRSPDGVVVDFINFCTRVHQSFPQTSIIFISVKPSPHRWKLQDQIEMTNAQIKKVCAEDARRIFVDVTNPMLTEEGIPNPKLYASDGIHMSQRGYQLWASLLKPHLNP